MMIKANALERNRVVKMDGAPHLVESVQTQTPSARGGATLYKVRFRNLQTRQKSDRTLRGDDGFEEVDFERRDAQFLYSDGDRYAFMDLEDYSQYELTREDLGEQALYLIDDLEGIRSLVSDGRVLGIELPDTVEMSIEMCDPSMKGASATARTKPATLQTGLVVHVPEYLAPGETIRVDTRSGAYISRA